MNEDGSNQQNLTNSPANDSGAAWSPAGDKIVFGSDRDGDWEVYLMNPDGSSVTQLTANTVGDGAAAWSPFPM